MNEQEFKKHQAKKMKQVAKKGREAFRAKFKTEEEYKVYFRKIGKKGGKHSKKNEKDAA